MIDRKSLLSTYMDMTPPDLEAALDVLGLIIGAKSSVTLTSASGHCFEEGQQIVLSGFVNTKLGGNWPHWMNKYRVPQRLRFLIQSLFDLFGREFGPRRYQIMSVKSGTEVTVASR